MAHRALVAYWDGDGYRLHYAHWGTGLAAAITPETPFGGRRDRSRVPPVPDRIANQFDLASSRDDAVVTRVDPRPLARQLAPADVLAAVDPTIEALVVVGPADETSTYLVCPLGLDGGEPLAVAGPTADEERLRQTLITAKDRLSELVDAGALSPERARRALWETLARLAPLYPIDDASFLRPD
ncbi:hypothetical protein GOC74_02830 [Halomicrobium mukohataei]|uniref:Uncharacterized protein n=1 Tax=Halomicrobium mukohataei TaxID=57705 RepID=A0A847UCS5_9EURY|nr:DUF6735 family protein [Halomicrobium mukohataei]NLV08868.1 hypothetical protein [Halomicrobium mukohataei]